MTDAERAKIIKKVSRQRKLISLIFKVTMKAFNKNAQELILWTEAGPVRVLCYGFEDKTTKPVFFDLHGGGFILMSADADARMNHMILQAVDCKIVSIDYALAPEHPFPTAVNQIYAVVKEMHSNAGKYGIDPERMAIGGHSAGGNLATVTCIQAARKGGFKFVCQMLNYPPLDLATSPYDKPCPKGAIKPKAAATYDACYRDPSQAEDPLVSPVYASREELGAMPPALIILAGGDSLRNEGEKYAGLLKDAGVDVELSEFVKEKHGFTYFRSKETPTAMKLISDFLTKHFFSGSI